MASVILISTGEMDGTRDEGTCLVGWLETVRDSIRLGNDTTGIQALPSRRTHATYGLLVS